MLTGAPIEAPVPKNRYASNPRNADWTIDQTGHPTQARSTTAGTGFSPAKRSCLPGRACEEALAAKARLELSRSGIPDFADLSERLAAMTGWRVVPVAGLIPDDAFFEHLANRRFPAGAFIRPEHELDYLEEPDIFHDVFGHVPLLANPVYARFPRSLWQGRPPRAASAASCTISRAFTGTRSSSG